MCEWFNQLYTKKDINYTYTQNSKISVRMLQESSYTKGEYKCTLNNQGIVRLDYKNVYKECIILTNKMPQ